MDHVRSLVALTHDRKAPDYIQFVAYLTIYTELRYKLAILKHYGSTLYPPNSLLATMPLPFDDLVQRNENIPYDSDEYARNLEKIEAMRLAKNAEIEELTMAFLESIETVLNSAYIKRYKYSPAYLDMLRRQLNNHLP